MLYQIASELAKDIKPKLTSIRSVKMTVEAAFGAEMAPLWLR
ncbi:hypothetical protein [Yersinia intermedia]|nr:hypothetical protein [Yersinia intermedia]MCW8114080.1 hypothetical protein [Yersinia intermedia]MDA5518869.1 hypothetical protein [Yersinia intermedia]